MQTDLLAHQLGFQIIAHHGDDDIQDTDAQCHAVFAHHGSDDRPGNQHTAGAQNGQQVKNGNRTGDHRGIGDLQQMEADVQLGKGNDQKQRVGADIDPKRAGQLVPDFPQAVFALFRQRFVEEVHDSIIVVGKKEAGGDHQHHADDKARHAHGGAGGPGHYQSGKGNQTLLDRSRKLGQRAAQSRYNGRIKPL